MLEFSSHSYPVARKEHRCDYVGDNEYDNDNVIDWVTEIVCGDCEHSHYDDGADDCSFSNMFVCPKVIERFAEKEEIREKE